MKSLTATRPKPLIEVAGRALIDHAFDVIDAIDQLRTVVNLHHFGHQVRQHLRGREIAFSNEADALLETGGGLRKALPLLGPDPVFTLNTDTIWRGPNPLAQLASSWDPDKMDALLLMLPTAMAYAHKGSGDFLIDHDGRLSRGPGLIYTGAQIIKTDQLPSIKAPAFSLNTLWDRFAQSGRLFGIVYAGAWCDVGHPAGILSAEKMLAGPSDV